MAFLEGHPETRERYERVAELIDGFETPYGRELLATTHWVVVHANGGDAHGAARLVREWTERKGRLLTDEHVAIAWKRLEEGWDTLAKAMADHIGYRNGPHRDQRLIKAERRLLIAA